MCLSVCVWPWSFDKSRLVRHWCSRTGDTGQCIFISKKENNSKIYDCKLLDTLWESSEIYIRDQNSLLKCYQIKLSIGNYLVESNPQPCILCNNFWMGGRRGLCYVCRPLRLCTMATKNWNQGQVKKKSNEFLAEETKGRDPPRHNGFKAFLIRNFLPILAPTYLLLPLGKWGSKWGDFH